jgi:hypothetical protein
LQKERGEPAGQIEVLSLKAVVGLQAQARFMTGVALEFSIFYVVDGHHYLESYEPGLPDVMELRCHG